MRNENEPDKSAHLRPTPPEWHILEGRHEVRRSQTRRLSVLVTEETAEVVERAQGVLQGICPHIRVTRADVLRMVLVNGMVGLTTCLQETAPEIRAEIERLRLGSAPSMGQTRGR